MELNRTNKQSLRRIKLRIAQSTQHFMHILSLPLFLFIKVIIQLMSKVHIKYFQYFFLNLRSFICLFVFYTTIPRRRGHRIVVDKKVVYPQRQAPLCLSRIKVPILSNFCLSEQFLSKLQVKGTYQARKKINCFIENFKLCEFLSVYQPIKGKPEKEKIIAHFELGLRVVSIFPAFYKHNTGTVDPDGDINVLVFTVSDR